MFLIKNKNKKLSIIIILLLCVVKCFGEGLKDLSLGNDLRTYDQFFIDSIVQFSLIIGNFRNVAINFCWFFLFLQMSWQCFQMMLVTIDIRKVFIDLLSKMIIVSTLMANYGTIVDKILSVSYNWGTSAGNVLTRYLDKLAENYNMAYKRVVKCNEIYGKIQGNLMLLMKYQDSDDEAVREIIKSVVGDTELMEALVQARDYKDIEDMEVNSPFLSELKEAKKSYKEGITKLSKGIVKGTASSLILYGSGGSAGAVIGGTIASSAVDIYSGASNIKDTYSYNKMISGSEQRYRNAYGVDKESYNFEDYNDYVAYFYKDTLEKNQKKSAEQLKNDIAVLKKDLTKYIDGDKGSVKTTTYDNALLSIKAFSSLINPLSEVRISGTEENTKLSLISFSAKESDLKDVLSSYYFDPFLNFQKEKNSENVFSQILSPSAFINANLFQILVLCYKLTHKVDYQTRNVEPIKLHAVFTQKGREEIKTTITDSVLDTVHDVFRLIIGFLIIIMLLIITVLSFFQYCTVIMEYYLITSIALIFVPLLFFDVTKQYGQNLLKIMINYFLKIFLTIYISFHCMTYIVGFMYTIGSNKDFASPATLLYVFFVGALLRSLISSIPQIATVLTSGEPRFGLGDVAHAVHSMMHMQQMVGNRVSKSVVEPAKKLGNSIGRNAFNAGVKGFYGAKEYMSYMKNHKGEGNIKDVRREAIKTAGAKLQEINREMAAYKGTSAFNAINRVSQRNDGSKKDNKLNESIQDNKEKMNKMSNNI